MEAKKVKAEVVDEGAARKPRRGFRDRAISAIIKLKILIAVCMDLADLVFGNIPILNTVWDFITVMVLLVTLKNKPLAFMALAELPLVGIPPFGLIDSVIPIATILTLVDIAWTRM